MTRHSSQLMQLSQININVTLGERTQQATTWRARRLNLSVSRQPPGNSKLATAFLTRDYVISTKGCLCMYGSNLSEVCPTEKKKTVSNPRYVKKKKKKKRKRKKKKTQRVSLSKGYPAVHAVLTPARIHQVPSQPELLTHSGARPTLSRSPPRLSWARCRLLSGPAAPCTAPRPH